MSNSNGNVHTSTSASVWTLVSDRAQDWNGSNLPEFTLGGERRRKSDCIVEGKLFNVYQHSLAQNMVIVYPQRFAGLIIALPAVKTGCAVSNSSTINSNDEKLTDSVECHREHRARHSTAKYDMSILERFERLCRENTYRIVRGRLAVAARRTLSRRHGDHQRSEHEKDEG